MKNSVDQVVWIELLRRDIVTFNQEIDKIPKTEKVMLCGADLAGLDITQAHIRRCDLSGADLTNSKVSGLELSRCRLQGTLLKGTTLDDDYWLPAITQIQMLWRDPEEWNSFRQHNRPAILESADFRGAQMGNADLSNVTLTTSNFDGACLRECNLTDTSFIGASLIKVDCTGLHTALTNFEGAILNGAYFDKAELRGVRMKKAIATGTSFIQASLINCDFSEITAIQGCFDSAVLEHALTRTVFALLSLLTATSQKQIL